MSKTQQDEQAVPQGATLAGWLREWEGDDSDLGQWLFAATEEEKDDSPNWRPVYWLNAAPTPPAQRVMLTPEEITEVIVDCYGYSADIEFHECLARAVIEAYERKNGLKP